MASPASSVSARRTGLPPGVFRGPLGRRLAAHLLDIVVPAAAIGLPLATRAGRAAVLVGLGIALVWGVVVWAMCALRAAGPGMRLTRLQLVGLSDGRPIGWGRFLVRALVLAALTVTGAGLVIMLVFLVRHPRHQGWHDLIADSVVIRQRMLAPPRGQPAAASRTAPSRPLPPPSDPQEFGTTVESPGLDLVGAPEQSAGEDQQATSATSAVREEDGSDREWLAVLDDGREIRVESLVLVGRDPTPRPGEEAAALVKIDDDSRTVSKSHLALGREGQGLYVRDLGSTNGSTVTDFTGVSRPCPADDAVWVTEGTIVSFGDHWLEIRRAEASVGSAHAPVGS